MKQPNLKCTTPVMYIFTKPYFSYIVIIFASFVEYVDFFRGGGGIWFRLLLLLLHFVDSVSIAADGPSASDDSWRLRT